MCLRSVPLKDECTMPSKQSQLITNHCLLIICILLFFVEFREILMTFKVSITSEIGDTERQVQLQRTA